ncbi:MAG: cob(I)yrinic acid a,c-diamide adenosyltransferase [Pseudomonadota bacterium]
MSSGLPHDDARHAKKMAIRKEAQDKKLADKTTGKGLLIVHTGTGKGKSTAAFGMAMRMIAQSRGSGPMAGRKVGIIQFIKGAWESGERAVLEAFPDVVEVHAEGNGFTWETQDRAKDIASVEAAWAQAARMLADEAYGMVILDELNIALRYDYLPLADIVAALTARPAMQHAVVTGRNAKPEMIEAADLVTEMTLIKHPFKEQAIKAQAGVEY